MKKLALTLDSLRVESFETVAAPGGRGTVHGHSDGYLGCTGREGCDGQTYDGNTCESTQYQDRCTCTQAGYTCDATLVTCNGYDDTCNGGCDGYTADIYCPTNPGYQGC